MNIFSLGETTLGTSWFEHRYANACAYGKLCFLDPIASTLDSHYVDGLSSINARTQARSLYSVQHLFDGKKLLPNFIHGLEMNPFRLTFDTDLNSEVTHRVSVRVAVIGARPRNGIEIEMSRYSSTEVRLEPGVIAVNINGNIYRFWGMLRGSESSDMLLAISFPNFEITALLVEAQMHNSINSFCRLIFQSLRIKSTLSIHDLKMLLALGLNIIPGSVFNLEKTLTAKGIPGMHVDHFQKCYTGENLVDPGMLYGQDLFLKVVNANKNQIFYKPIEIGTEYPFIDIVLELP